MPEGGKNNQSQSNEKKQEKKEKLNNFFSNLSSGASDGEKKNGKVTQPELRLRELIEVGIEQSGEALPYTAKQQEVWNKKLSSPIEIETDQKKQGKFSLLNPFSRVRTFMEKRRELKQAKRDAEFDAFVDSMVDNIIVTRLDGTMHKLGNLQEEIEPAPGPNSIALPEIHENYRKAILESGDNDLEAYVRKFGNGTLDVKAAKKYLSGEDLPTETEQQASDPAKSKGKGVHGGKWSVFAKATSIISRKPKVKNKKTKGSQRDGVTRNGRFYSL